MLQRKFKIGFNRAARLIDSMEERGVTVLKTKGGYTNEGRVMIISVLSSRQLVELKDKIRTIDEKSFMIVGQVTEVFGEGFTKFSS